MPAIKSRRPKETVGTRGDAIYEAKIKPILKPRDKGKYVAIDVKTGEYEIAADLLDACDRLNARTKNAEIWLVLVGSRYLSRFGGHKWRDTK